MNTSPAPAQKLSSRSYPAAAFSLPPSRPYSVPHWTFSNDPAFQVSAPFSSVPHAHGYSQAILQPYSAHITALDPVGVPIPRTFCLHPGSLRHLRSKRSLKLGVPPFVYHPAEERVLFRIGAWSEWKGVTLCMLNSAASAASVIHPLRRVCIIIPVPPVVPPSHPLYYPPGPLYLPFLS